MTSATNDKPSAKMATAGRQSRLPNYTMANGTDKPSHNIAFQTNNIWTNNGLPSFGPREASGSRGSENGPYTEAPSGSGALTADSEADPWHPRHHQWNTSDNGAPRKGSGNSSPTRTRDMPSLSDASTPSYVPTPQPIGRSQSFMSNLSKPLDSSNNAIKYNAGVSDLAAEKENYPQFPNPGRFDVEPSLGMFRKGGRGAQDPAAFRSVGGPTHDAAPNAAGGHSDPTSVHQGYAESYVGHHSAVGHAHRPSTHISPGFPSRGAPVIDHAEEEDLNQSFERFFPYGDAAEATVATSAAAYPAQQAPTTFQLNAASAPWSSILPELGTSVPVSSTYSFNTNGLPSTRRNPPKATNNMQPSARPFTHESHETIMAGYSGSKRGSIADRGSPAGANFRSNMTSPRNTNGTPPASDLWAAGASRPSSRDPRNGTDLERRVSANSFLLAQQQQQQQIQYQQQQQLLEYQQQQQQLQYQQQHQLQYAHHLPPASSPAPTFYPPTGPYATNNMPPVFDAHSLGLRQPTGLLVPGFNMRPLAFSQFPLNGANLPTRHGRAPDPTTSIRSHKLEEFRLSSRTSKKWDLKEIIGHVVEFCGDQHASRWIQTKLETANSDDKEMIFREMEPNALQLMKDVFGNYVVQKFFEHGNQIQKKILAGQMKGKVLDLSVQMYACRVVQKALEHVLVEQQAELVKELEQDVLRIVKDQNGNHVIQKVIELVPRRHIDFVLDSFRGQVHQLASHTYACRVIQRMLEHGTEEDVAVIMAELYQCASSLITDQYGNYVIQHIIEKGKPEDRDKFIDKVMEQLVTFSKHKFASNVVEKCIEHGTPERRSQICQFICKRDADGNSPLHLMSNDQYANYVIQSLHKFLNAKNEPDFALLTQEMKPYCELLKKQNKSRQVQALDRLISASSSPIGSPASANRASAGPPGPVSPPLQVDVSSPAPTPVLTMEPNTPQSSSPPSTNASAPDELVEDHSGGGCVLGKDVRAVSATGRPEVRVAAES